jgi:hypothetical protein
MTARKSLGTLVAAGLTLALSGCAKEQAAENVAQPVTSTTPAQPGSAAADPLATAPVPPAPPSSTFTWPSPANRQLDKNAAPRGVPNIAKFNRQDAAAVALAFAITAYAVDARTDETPTAAGTRAAALATPKLAAALKQAPAAGDADWTGLVAARGYRAVQAVPNKDGGAPAGDVTTAYASYVLTITNQPGAARTLTVYLKLTRPDAKAPWAVDEMRGNA